MTKQMARNLVSYTVLDLWEKQDLIQLDPEYQRRGEVWPLSRRQLLIDSMLNDYDIPKIYLRRFLPRETLQDGREVEFAVVDGRQRLETIWAFLRDEFVLGDDQSPNAISGLSNLRASELKTQLPNAYSGFLNYHLDVVTLETNDLDTVEDMFLRLNESSPLNAAEKRNAFGGPLPRLSKEVAEHSYFMDCLPFSDARYRFRDMAAKFLFFEHRKGVADTKKAYLDRFFRAEKDQPSSDLAQWAEAVKQNLNTMSAVFGAKDPLLQSVGMSSVYYLLFRTARERDLEIHRADLARFESARAANRERAKSDDEDADLALLEFDGYSQSPNDVSAMRFRHDTLLNWIETGNSEGVWP